MQHLLLLVGLLEGGGEEGVDLEVFGDNGDGWVLHLDEVKEVLPGCLHPQIVLLHTHTDRASRGRE